MVWGDGVGLCWGRGFEDVGSVVWIVGEGLVEVVEGKDGGEIVFWGGRDEGVDGL